MSFQAMAWAVKQKVGNATGKAILLMLANYADEKGKCWPSQETLAEECECSVATVARWLNSFAEMGFLTRVKQYGEGGYRRADVLLLEIDLPVRELPSTELPNSDAKLTRHSDGAEPITEPINNNITQAQAQAKRTPRSELLAVLDAERADAVIAHRQRIRKPLTDRAAKLLADKFARCPDPNVAADAMIANGWQGFEPEWLQRQNNRGSPVQVARPQTVSQILRDRRLNGTTANDDRTSGTPNLPALGYVP
jgi:hypothetical protein